MDHDVESLARKDLDDMNRGDMDAVRDARDPHEYVYEQSGDVRVEGRDAALEWFRQWRAAFPDLNGELLRSVAAGDTVVSEIRWTGFHRGALPEAAGGAAATGRGISALGTMWQTYRDGKLIAERNHFDGMLILTQLGLMAPPPA
ncbi:ester cyclase [Actinomycetospora sp. TBRC 11914]|uniref:ester cyclase n=1 Tax=Actinomycetospora sp. TBRC 11914 TaxID=2729387 RepID=UPI00145D4A1A|nr:ester cyclase [Actinomycetospora sp. TBRC 11914]NMO92334.1 ester cyclase [Actinomycetospora sp. TBRC 11914]